jgi:hypothetical protein
MAESSRSLTQFLGSDLGALFASQNDGDPTEKTLLAFWNLYKDIILGVKAPVRASFFALLLEVVSRPRTAESNELQRDLSLAKTAKNNDAIKLAEEAVENDRNERAPAVEGFTIGRMAMVQLIEAFKEKVQEKLQAEKESIAATKATKSCKTKAAASS